MNPWTLALLVVGPGTFEAERRALARDAQRGTLVRVRQGVYADRGAWAAFSPEQRHVVAMRALAAVAPEPPVFSHWSAAVLHGLPFLGRHFDRVHTTVDRPEARGRQGVAGHVAALLPGQSVTVGTLQVTAVARTVLDVALATPFVEGVVIADAALRAGLQRQVLLDALAAAVGRRGLRRAEQVIAFARPEAESPAESVSRECMFRMGMRPPVLQHEVFDRLGLAGRLDFWFPWLRVGGEVDGEKKYLTLEMAPLGAARAVVAEKWREDRVRAEIQRLARWSWRDAANPARLGPILAKAGVFPDPPRATFEAYAHAAVSV